MENFWQNDTPVETSAESASPSNQFWLQDEPVVPFGKLPTDILTEAANMGEAVLALPEIIGGAAGTLVGGALDYAETQMSSNYASAEVEKKLNNGEFVSQEEYDAVKKQEEEATWKNSFGKAHDVTRDAASWLNLSKNADKFLDWYMPKIGKGEEWATEKQRYEQRSQGSTTTKFFNWIGTTLEEGAGTLEKDFGIPKEATIAAAELAMFKLGKVAKPIKGVAEGISEVTGATGLVKKAFGESDRAQVLKQIDYRTKLGYDSPHLKETLNATNWGKYTDTNLGIPYNIPTEKMVNEYLQSNPDLAKNIKSVKDEQGFIEAAEQAGRSQNKLDKTYVTLVVGSLETKLRKLLGTDKAAHTQMYNKIVDYMEHNPLSGPKPKLDKNSLKVYKEVFEPGLKEYNRLIKKLNRAGRLERKIIIDESLTGPFFPRRKLQARPGLFKNLFGDTFKINDPYAKAYQPASTSAREYYAIEDASGNRRVIARDKDTTNVLEAVLIKGKKKMVLSRDLSDLNKKTSFEGSGEMLGKYRVKEVTRKELERLVDVEYVSNPAAVLFDRIGELRQIERDMMYEKNIKESPYFKENAKKFGPGEPIPEGYKKVGEDLQKAGIGKLQDYYYKDRAAEILEDANRPRPDTLLTKVSDALVKNMMLNPLPHMHNELIHFYSTKGFMRTWSKEAREAFKEDYNWAMEQVLEMGPEYRKALSEGSSMMGTNVKNTNALDSIFKEGVKSFYSKSDLTPIAKAMNRTVGETYAKISNKAQSSMWTTRDVMFMMLVKQKMRQYPKATMKEAIELVEHHMPTYRMPIRVGEKILGAKMSRSLSKILQNQNVVIFARYKHGMIKSGLNTVRDMLAPFDAPLRKVGLEGVADFVNSEGVRGMRTLREQTRDGIDSGLALASAMMIIYPIMDMFFSEVFNNDETHMRRAGILHVLDTARAVGSGSKDPYALFANMATVNPTLMLGGELLLNTTAYNGRQIYNIDDPLQYQAADVLRKLGSAVPLASQIVNSQGVEGSLAARQIDVKLKSDKQKASEIKNKKRRETELLKRTQEREQD